MSSQNSPKKSVKTVRESQQKDKEARDLLRDLDSLVTLKPERKIRWIWELIQNAVDCAEDNRVNISIKLTNDKIVFSHDGVSFNLENLVALVTKSSTKSSEGLEGKKGKFGTGFVSTHVLNKKVTVSGVFLNDIGQRQFTLDIDRDTDSLPTLADSLEKAFERIDSINDLPPDPDCTTTLTAFEYGLDANKFNIAKGGIEELQRDVPFTLLVNKDQLRSVTITNEFGKVTSFSIEEPVKLIDGLHYLPIVTESSNTSGLLFSKTDTLTIAFPVQKNAEKYSLVKINDQAKVFRNFPLIGTEKFHSPCFLHSEFFQPSEQRDGIRTLKDDELKPDKFADENRRVLEGYSQLFNITFSKLIDCKVTNFHLLAESGLPENSQNYLAIDWFVKSVQKPIRDFLLQHDLVNTVNGTKIKIGAAKFMREYESELDLYNIASNLFPESFPDKDSYPVWKKIIDQDSESWPEGIFIDLEVIVNEASAKSGLDNLKVFEGDPIVWLNSLVSYLLKNNRIDLIEQYALYPNQIGEFKKRSDLRLDPGYKFEFKIISEKIYRNLRRDFVLDQVKYPEGIREFETAEFYTGLNDFFGKFEVSKATDEQVAAIFELGCYFKGELAQKRNEWFDLVSIILPNYAKNKIITTELKEYNFDSVDKWTLKYVSWLLQNAITLENLSQKYFENNSDAAYEWMNRFINYVCRSDENRDIAFKFAIVLTQDGHFRKYENNLYRENNHEDFEDLFKVLAKEFTNKDPKSYLIDTRLKNEFLIGQDAYYLTGQLDNIFKESNIAQEVEEGKKYNALFHKLNEWYAKKEEIGEMKREKFFPIFKEKRPDLSVRAFGKEVSKMLAEKGITEMKALSTLKLSSAVLSQLETAAHIAGGHQVLLDKAKEIFDEAERIRWRQEVGTSAEVAFKEAMSGIETVFDIENPDVGKDFTIKSGLGKEFYIEIKSTIIGQDNVKMSALQGETANKEKDRYALCVITRPSGALIDMQYFIDNVKFVTNIGELIGDKVTRIKDEIKLLSQHEYDDVAVSMEDKTYSVYVKKKIWESGMDFPTFVSQVTEYLEKK